MGYRVRRGRSSRTIVFCIVIVDAEKNFSRRLRPFFPAVDCKKRLKRSGWWKKLCTKLWLWNLFVIWSQDLASRCSQLLTARRDLNLRDWKPWTRDSKLAVDSAKGWIGLEIKRGKQIYIVVSRLGVPRRVGVVKGEVQVGKVVSSVKNSVKGEV